MFRYKFLIACGAIFFMTGCQTRTPIDIGILPPPAALPKTTVSGEVEVYYWNGISGNNISNLTSIAAFPDNPDQVIKLSQLNSPRNIDDNFGSLVRGYIIPPTSGSYTFWVAGDDQTEFWLSSTDQRERKELIATVPGATSPLEYSKYSSQKSANKNLSAGARYYFEIIHKEGFGSDHFSLAWSGPGFSQSILSGNALASFAETTTSEIIQSPEEVYREGYAVGFLDGSAGFKYTPLFPPPDQDNDGLYDNWEIVHGLDPLNPEDATSDPDNDLLVAADEFLIGTAENNPDTDGDGITDGDEYAYNLDPLDATDAAGDLDGDGVTNLDEFLAGSNPAEPDAPAMDEPDGSGELAYIRGVTGQYFQGMNFDKFLIARHELEIQFDAGSGAFVPEQPYDNFSARWYGEFTAPHDKGTRSYTFSTRTDDGTRLYIDGEQFISAWRDQGATSYTASLPLEAGQTVTLLMEYYENGGAAVAQLFVTDTSTDTNLNLYTVTRSPDLQISNMADTDNDGIPDVWELRNGLDAWRDDASDINNNAGISNIEAYQSSISPWTLEPVVTSESQTADEGTITEPAPTTLATATLSWTAPLTRVDGSSIALSEIQSYEILYGQSPDNLTNTTVVGGSQTTAEISGLTSGTWYFSIRVVDADGLKSENSEILSYKVP